MPAPIVLHVASDPITLARLVKPLANRQRKAGWTVRFASGPGDHQRALTHSGFEATTLPLSRRSSPWAAARATLRLRRLLARERPAVVHVHNPAAALPVRLASGGGRRHKVLYHLRGSLWDSPRLLDRLLFTVSEAIAARYTDYALTLNRLDAEELVTRGLLPRDRVHSVGCGGSGVDLAEYRRSDSTIAGDAPFGDRGASPRMPSSWVSSVGLCREGRPGVGRGCPHRPGPRADAPARDRRPHVAERPRPAHGAQARGDDP